MARWATGVSVVTASHEGHDAGLTVNALLSVSLEPPSLLVSLQKDVDTLGVIEQSGSFAVSVLSARQRAVSERFARAVPSVEKFRELPVHRGATGAPILDGVIAAVECRLTSVVPAHDHRLLLGEVVRTELGSDTSPLLFFRSGYGAEEGPLGVRLPPPAP
jgi:3-hydroxy-9,10-secoandrosta-1,3,5(10)-triene-9,17-dione monooxygenase reductase component